MKFIEAEKKSEELAKGEYRSLTYKKIITPQGKITTECALFINPNRVDGSSWEEALDKMERLLNPPPIVIEEPPDK